MADGDKVHGKLKLRYQNSYKQLCENAGTNSSRAKSVLKALKQSLQERGNHPVRLAQAMAESLQQSVESSGGLISISWSSIRMGFEELARSTDGSPYTKEIVLRAGGVVLNAYRNQRENDVENVSSLIVKQYMREVYESEFKERIPLTDNHHNGVDEIVLIERVNSIGLDILSAIGKWADKVSDTGQIKDIRMPQQPKQLPVDLDEDLLCA